MANWRRGFFRLWVLMAILWAVLVALISSGGILSPYVPETLFTFNTRDQLEVVPSSGEKYSKLVSDEASGYYSRVRFEEDADRMIYMAPNVLEVVIRGKKFKLMSKERVANPDHEGLVTFLLAFIKETEADLDPPITADEIRAAIPPVLPLQYQGREVLDQTHRFAVDTQARLADEARRNAIVSAATIIVLPPIVVLLLGWAFAWVLSGFRRGQHTAKGAEMRHASGREAGR